MNRKIFNLRYPIKNIQLIIENRFLSAISANGIAPMILGYITYPYIEKNSLIIWLGIHLLVLCSRILLSTKIKKLILLNQEEKVHFYFKIIIFLALFSALLHSYIVWLAFLNGIPSLYLFMLSIISITLSAGSISTTVTIFNVYVAFILLSMIPLIVLMLYHGGEIFNIFASILVIFTAIIIKTGYKQYLILENIFTFKETFKTIYEKSHDAIILIKDKQLHDCNPATIEMFQFNSKEELLNAHILEYMPKYQYDGSLSQREILKMVYITLKDGHNSFEWLYKKKDGTLFWCDVVLTKIVIDGEILIHGVYRDINKKKELQKEQEMFQELLKNQVAQEVEKNRKKDKMMVQQSRLAQMGEMISMIAHQWRQPLSAISAASGSIQIKAKREKLTNTTAIELSKNISQYAQHLSSTIDDFRNFFKENKMKEKTTLQEMTISTLNIVNLSLKSKNITLTTEFDTPQEIATYVNEFKQVLLNIIKNAEDVLLEREIKNPQITIKILNNELTISDNAGGVDEKNIHKIFEPYFSTKTKKDGTGLGLYMSKTIIEEHCNGVLSITNNKVGAEFKIQI